MFYADNVPPHFHAEYSEHEVRVAIDSLAILSGQLPPRAMELVTEWASLHRQELQAAWARARQVRPPGSIEPLSQRRLTPAATIAV
jgi:hypothetical protein